MTEETKNEEKASGLKAVPLNGKTFAAYVERLRLPAAGVDYIRRTMSGFLSRRAESHGGNSVVLTPFVKSNSMLRLESRTHEFFYVRMLDRDPDVLAAFEQPGTLAVHWKLEAGDSGTREHPDLLVLRLNRVVLVAVKPAKALEKLVKSHPHRWQWDEERKRFRNKAGEQAAALLGFEYEVVSTTELNPVLIRNLAVLDDYYRDTELDFPDELKALVVQAVKVRPGLSLAELYAQTGSKLLVHWMLSRERIWVDLHRFDLEKPETCLVFPDEVSALGCKALAHAFNEICDPIAGHEATEAALDRSRWRDVSLSEQAAARRRLEALMDPHGKEAKRVHPATFRRWKARARTARVGGVVSTLSALCRRRGSKEPEEPTAELKFMIEQVDLILREKLLCQDPLTVTLAYAAFQKACNDAGHTPRGRTWFFAQIQKVSNYQRLLAQKGHRAAYQQKLLTVNDDLFIHGAYPLHLVHIDHTLLDTELLDVGTGVNLGRIWLTIAVDAFTRRIVAFHLSFDAPSIDSIAACLRWLVCMHGRLPNTLTVDNGVEFRSNWFGDLVAAYEIHVQHRPTAYARAGAVCERVFRTQNQQLIHMLKGNTRLMKDPRLVTKFFNPENRACWNVPNLFELLAIYFYDLYDQEPHDTLTISPRAMWDHAMASEDRTKLRTANYDEFFFLSLRPASRPFLTVHAVKGIRMHGLCYVHPVMKSGDIEGTKALVRYDPMNLAYVYAFMGNRWYACQCIAPAFSARRGIFRISESLLHMRKRRLKKSRTEALLELHELIDTEEKALQQKRDDASRAVAPFMPRFQEQWQGGRAATVLLRLVEQSTERLEDVRKVEEAENAEKAKQEAAEIARNAKKAEGVTNRPDATAPPSPETLGADDAAAAAAVAAGAGPQTLTEILQRMNQRNGQDKCQENGGGQ